VGWRCAEVIRSKGLERITVDELVQIITPRGRGKNRRKRPCPPHRAVAKRWFVAIHSHTCFSLPLGPADTVPDQIKADLLQRIRQFLQST
jgi:hypothetical protein